MEHRIILSFRRNNKVTGRKKFWKYFLLYKDSNKTISIETVSSALLNNTENHRRIKHLENLKYHISTNVTLGNKADINSDY